MEYDTPVKISKYGDTQQHIHKSQENEMERQKCKVQIPRMGFYFKKFRNMQN